MVWHYYPLLAVPCRLYMRWPNMQATDSLARNRRFIAMHAGRPWITPAPKLPPASDALAQLLAAALLDGGDWGYDLLIAAALEADRIDHQTWGPFLERTACLVQQARAAIWAGRFDPPAPD